MPFAKGQSGNPKGRTPGTKNKLSIRRELAKLTGDGKDTLAFFVSCMKGEVLGAKVADRVKAADWVAKWQFGEAPSISPITPTEEDDKAEANEPPADFAKLLQFPVDDPLTDGETGPATDGAGE